MTLRYATVCRMCGKGVTTKAPESAQSVRVRCAGCGTTNFVDSSVGEGKGSV